MFVLGLFAGGVANAAYASRNDNKYKSCVSDNNKFCDDLAAVRDAEAAAAVSRIIIIIVTDMYDNFPCNTLYWSITLLAGPCRQLRQLPQLMRS